MSLSSAQLLYTDGLHSIFKYLSLADLLSSIHSCRSWSQAAYKEKSRKIETPVIVAPTQFSSLMSWPLRHHITNIDASGGESTMNDVSLLRDLSSLNHLTLLVNSHSIVAIDNDESVAATSILWPQRLLSLTIRIQISSIVIPISSGRLWRVVDSSKDVQMLIDTIAQLSSLTSLDIDVDSEEIAARTMNFTPLKQLSNLIHLTIPSPTIKQLLIIKHISTLRRVLIDQKWSSEQLESLCSPPHQLDQLEEISMGVTILSSTHLEHLMNLPALNQLRPYAFAPDALPFLSHIPSLKQLRIKVFALDQASGETFIPHVMKCVKLTHLELSYCKITESNLRELFAALPLLSTLRLSDLRSRLPQFDCFADAHSLTELYVLKCQEIVPQHLLQLISAPCLIRLEVDLRTKQIESMREMLQPPSIHLPNLLDLTINSLRL